MYSIKKNDDLVAEVRKIDEKLVNSRLTQIEIVKSEKRIKYVFICENVIDEDLQKKVWVLARKLTSPVFLKVNVYFKKIVSNDEIINNEIYKYLKENYPSLSMFLKPTDVRSQVLGENVKYVVRLSADGVDYVSKNNVFYKLNGFLATKFCSTFLGSTELKEEEEIIDLTSVEVFEAQKQKVEYRTIKVKDVVVIDSFDMGDTAFYIEDAEYGYVTLCGKITEVREKETTNGKPFFIFNFDDTTGQMSGVYFSKKSTVDKIRDLKEDDGIIMTGKIGDYKGKKSFTIEKINKCTFPEDFKKRDRYKKQTPKTYSVIKPTEATTVKISSVFDDYTLPEELTSAEYVVFDLETTGLDVMNNGIVEIGAVKIKNGKIAEQFQTLIKPDYVISPENEAVHGISNEMVKDAPKIDVVIPDFIKFIDGAILVAHNAEFDTKFIKRFANAEDYEIKNKILDTMVLSRRYLPFLKKSDLHTVADYFNITFHHHRALSDAYATAEAFIEIMKIKAKEEKNG